MIVNERTDNNGTYLLIERKGKRYRTESFTSLASLYTNMPIEVYRAIEKLDSSNLRMGDKFATLDLSNVGTYQLHVI